MSVNPLFCKSYRTVIFNCNIKNQYKNTKSSNVFDYKFSFWPEIRQLSKNKNYAIGCKHIKNYLIDCEVIFFEIKIVEHRSIIHSYKIHCKLS